MGGFSSIKEAGFTLFNGFLLLCVIVFPIFVFLFLTNQRDKLEDPQFKKKYNTMYLGVNLDHMWSIIYFTPFCIRRFLLVMCLLSFGKDNDKIIIFSVLLLQSIYLAYLAYTSPHIEENFNKLEIINELAVVILVYLMFAFISDSIVLPSQ